MDGRATGGIGARYLYSTTSIRHGEWTSAGRVLYAADGVEYSNTRKLEMEKTDSCSWCLVYEHWRSRYQGAEKATT